MNSLRDIARSADAQLEELLPDVPLPPRRIYEGPHYDGKQCAVCQRKYKTSAEYVSCKLCKVIVCRRRDDCKRLHHAEHYLAAKAQRKEEA